MKALAAASLTGLLLATACTPGHPLPSTELALLPDGVPARALVNVPFQRDETACGPGSLAMAMGWRRAKIMDNVRLTGLKSDPDLELSAAARRANRLAYPVRGVDAMMREVAAGHPVLVVQNLGFASRPVWRCSVVFGYDAEKRRVYLHGPSEEALALPLHLFERLWGDREKIGMVLLPPGEMPASAEEGAYYQAVSALTRDGMAWESVMAFDAALAMWPESGETLVGLGDALTALGDLEGAARAYREGAAKSRDPALALISLAEVLTEMGRLDEALAVARMASASAKGVAMAEKTLGEQNR